jgi:hypothetical protein
MMDVLAHGFVSSRVAETKEKHLANGAGGSIWYQHLKLENATGIRTPLGVRSKTGYGEISDQLIWPTRCAR